MMSRISYKKKNDFEGVHESITKKIECFKVETCSKIDKIV